MAVWRITFVAVSISLFSGCATSPPAPEVNFSGYQQGRWVVQMRVVDKKRGENHNLEATVVAKFPGQLRVDAMTMMGSLVMALVMSGDEVRYILPRDKRFYITNVDERAFLPVLNFPLDPRVFMALLFDRPPTDKVWNCVMAENGLLESCRHLRDKTRLVWSEREGQRRKLQIFTRYVDVEMNLGDFAAKVENPAKIFQLKPPKGYQVIKDREGA